jgi:hypothetical protein
MRYSSALKAGGSRKYEVSRRQKDATEAFSLAFTSAVCWSRSRLWVACPNRVLR